MAVPSAFHAIASSIWELGDDGDGEKVEANDSQTPPIQRFFRDVWQVKPAIFRNSADAHNDFYPPHEVFSMTWDDVADLLHHCRHKHTSSANSPPLFFRNGTPISDPQTNYASNPHAAYLDACSIIINHADFHHHLIAKLCEDLQGVFPHCYANTYLTPACAHAVKAHADDRDVLVLQILGRKVWKVYKKVPVEFPFEHEQVGKKGNSVPPEVLNGGLCFENKEVTMSPGDVMYLPRGFVHEASTEDSSSGCVSPSFHITIAIATHDWCLSVLLSETIRNTMDGVTSFRKALPVGPCNEYAASNSPEHSMEQLVDSAMSVIQRKITPGLLEERLQEKYRLHNENAKHHRQKVILAQQSRKRKAAEETSQEECVGCSAASKISLQSTLRLSTPEEKASVILGDGQLRGLNVRESIQYVITEILSTMKSDPLLRVKVKDLRGLVKNGDGSMAVICDFTLLSFARCCVELGALALVE